MAKRKQKNITFTAVEECEVYGRSGKNVLLAFLPVLHEKFGGRKIGLMMEAPLLRNLGREFVKMANAMDELAARTPEEKDRNE